MVDRRRDATYEIPAATIAQLKESQKKLAKRQETLDFENGPALPVASPPPPDGPTAWHEPPRGKIPREELEAQFGAHLEPFSPARRDAFFQAYGTRAYARACLLLEEEAKRQPMNLSISKEARAIRAYTLGRAESEIGGLSVKPQKAKPLSTVEGPNDLLAMLRLIDGQTPIERMVRDSGVDRLRALDFLLDLARSRYLELPVEDAVPEPPAMPAPSTKSGATPRVQPPAESSTESAAVEPPTAVSTAPLSSTRRPRPTPEPVRPRVRSAPERQIPAVVPVVLGGVVAFGIALAVIFYLRKPPTPAPVAAARAPADAPARPAPSPTIATPEKDAEPAPPPAIATVRLKISAEPKYARVKLDGVLLTGSPIEIEIPKSNKEHVLEVESAGYKVHKTAFVADANQSFVISLQRLPPKPN